MKYIDLSHEINNEMPIYPGDKEVKISSDKEYSVDGYNSFSLCSSMHAGTHIDAPLHMQQNKEYISQYPIERFIGNVTLLDVRGEAVIGIKDEYYKTIKENDIVLLLTGWDEFYGTDKYYNDHPIISSDFAELLIGKKVKMVGVDMPSVDKDPYNIHNRILGNEIFLLENLTNLNKLLYNENIQIFAQPLKINSDASLVRAVAFYQGY